MCDKFLDQILRKNQQKYIPNPVGVWPLSKSSLTEESTTDMTVYEEDVGIDPLWTPAGFLGSPLLSPAYTILNSHLIVGYKNAMPSWTGLTIMCWLRLANAPAKSQVIMVQQHFKLVILYLYDFF